MLTAARRTLGTARRGDDGVTLVELLVSLVLSTILGAITLTLFIYIGDSTSRTTDRSVSTAQARNALQSWSAYLQVADDRTASGLLANRIEWLTPSGMLFYADINNRSSSSVATTGAATMVWLRIDAAGELVEEQFAATPSSYPAAPTVCRILVTGVRADPLFTAFDALGNDMTASGTLDLGTALTAGNGCQPLPSAPPSQSSHPDTTATANLESVAEVKIHFTANNGKQHAPLVFITVVALPVDGGV